MGWVAYSTTRINLDFVKRINVQGSSGSYYLELEFASGTPVSLAAVTYATTQDTLEAIDKLLSPVRSL